MKRCVKHLFQWTYSPKENIAFVLYLMRLISYASPSDSNTETRLAILFAIKASDDII